MDTTRNRDAYLGCESVGALSQDPRVFPTVALSTQAGALYSLSAPDVTRLKLERRRVKCLGWVITIGCYLGEPYESYQHSNLLFNTH